MTVRSKILVTGATGNVGGEVVSQLASTGVAVRALVRNPSSADLPDVVEVVRGDLSDPGSLESALDGVEAVFLVWPFLTAGGVSGVLDVIARHARRIVYLSSMGVRDDLQRQADPINQFHADIERLIEVSGLQWTLLRCGGLATNALGWAEQIRSGSVVRELYGEAARSPIHERDVAAVAARALTEDGHGGAKFVLTGPEVLTQARQVGIIGDAIGRPLRWAEILPETAWRGWLAEGWPPSVVDGILDAHAGMVAQPEPVTRTVEEISGAPARTFLEWATDHAGDFRGSPVTSDPTTGQERDVEAIRRIVADIETGFNTKDPDLSVEHFADDTSTVNVAGTLLSGRDALLDANRRGLSGPLRDRYARYEVSDVVFLRPDVAIAHKRAWATTADGEPIDIDHSMIALYVLVKEGARWWVVARQNTLVTS